MSHRSPGQIHAEVTDYLRDLGEPYQGSQGDLARRFGVSRQWISDVLLDLESRGFVRVETYATRVTLVEGYE